MMPPANHWSFPSSSANTLFTSHLALTQREELIHIWTKSYKPPNDQVRLRNWRVWEIAPEVASVKVRIESANRERSHSAGPSYQ